MGLQRKSISPQIGEVYAIEFVGSGSEQKGFRPGLVFQNNTGNLHSPNIIALPFTRAIKKQRQPTHVLIKAEDSGLKYDSMLLCENPERVSKERIGHYITTLPEHYMQKAAEASLLATSAISYLDFEMLIAVWEKANALNAVAAMQSTY